MTTFCRNYIRKQIIAFPKDDKGLKGHWKIEKKVMYNHKEYPNEIGLKCDEDSGFSRLGTEISPDGEGGYYMINYTVWEGKVTWNAELRFNSKMTCVGGYMNLFTLGPSKFMKGKEMCEDYLEPFLKEYINERGGFLNPSEFSFIRK